MEQPSIYSPPLPAVPVIPRLTIPADNSLEDLKKASESGDLEKVMELVEGKNRPLDYLDYGLCAAVGAGQVAVARCLFENGAIIAPGIAIKAATAKSVKIFELLMEYGWGVNDPSCGGFVVLPYVLAPLKFLSK